MENKLKPESASVLKTLNECEIRTVLATGDNVLTAISVARNCKMLDPAKTVFLGEVADKNGQEVVVWNQIEGNKKQGVQSTDKGNGLPWHYSDSSIEVALTGPAFHIITENKDKDQFTYNSVCMKAQVFARMSPLDKDLLIQALHNVCK